MKRPSHRIAWLIASLLSILMGCQAALGDIRDVAVQVHHPSGRLVTGTVIKAAPTQAWVLTCAHLWTGETDRSPVTVETFEYDPSRAAKYDGQLIGKDHSTDLALVVMDTRSMLESCAIWQDCETLAPGLTAWSLGCERGIKPAARKGTLVGWERSPHGKPHTMAATPAVDFGRSGGGLFVTMPGHDGACVAGVLVEFGRRRTATDPGTGLYSGPDKIHPFLLRHAPTEFGRWIRCSHPN